MTIIHSDETVPLEQQHGRLYWFSLRIWEALMSPLRKHPVFAKVLLAALIMAAVMLRAFVQPVFLAMRLHTFDIIVGVLLLLGLRTLKRFLEKRRVRRKIFWFVAFLTILTVWTAIGLGFRPNGYLSHYLRYLSLDPVDLKDLPETGHERIQPLHSIRVLASEAMDVVEHPSEPDFVRVGESYRFTMAIEPTMRIPRLTGEIRELYDIPGDVASANFSKESRVPVRFAVGEHMQLGKNARVCTIKSFNPFRFLSYKPGDVKYMKDDQGKWVEVVTLSRLKGLVFPRPEFGGVQIIQQSPGGWFHAIKNLIVGEGTWVRPEDISKYPFLKGQNIVPYEVSRYVAESFRFQNGFWGPAFWYHRGDIRIPDLPGDVNDQPFTIFAKFDVEGSPDNKLWHYFALEPWQEERQGLNTSVFVPADGIGKVRVYRHYLQNEGLTGVSAIAAKVMESRKLYDWTQSQPAEQRPWIHIIDGKKRFFWLTTVVTYKHKGSQIGDDYIAGSVPEVVLTDALYKRAIWVKADHPESWNEEVRKELSDVWRSEKPPVLGR